MKSAFGIATNNSKEATKIKLVITLIGSNFVYSKSFLRPTLRHSAELSVFALDLDSVVTGIPSTKRLSAVPQ